MYKNMTREEAVKYFKRHINLYCVDVVSRQAEEMAIEALKKEPCEDAISKKAALDCLKASSLKKFDWIIDARKKIEALPPVTPIRPKGRWIKDRCDMYQCSECSHTYTDLSCGDNMANYCPICGADMQGVADEIA